MELRVRRFTPAISDLTFVDVTARKRAKQSIEAVRVRLQARPQAVLEQMPGAILVGL